jgi:hypothetical protein
MRIKVLAGRAQYTIPIPFKIAGNNRKGGPFSARLAIGYGDGVETVLTG